MGDVVAKKDGVTKSWARLKLDNGDQVKISIGKSGVKISKMKWAGMIPEETLWESRSREEVAKKLFDPRDPLRRPLDLIIDKLINCSSAEEIVENLSGEFYDRDDVLQHYAATLEKTPRGVIRDDSELPYAKDVIKSALQQCMKLSKDDKQTFERFKNAYIALADFLPLTNEERDAVSVMGAVRDFRADEQVQRVDKYGDIYAAVLARSRAELDSLKKELNLLQQNI